jgi:hypothetical protein
MKNLVTFFEIPAVDFDRAVRFYEAIFNTTLPVCGCEKEKMAFFKEEEKSIGAISFAPGLTPSSKGTLIYFYCNDIDETLSIVKNSGGKIVTAKTEIPGGWGYSAVITDSEGNNIGLHSDK